MPPDAEAFFHLLLNEKDAIEAQLGYPLDWQALPERKGSRIARFRQETDPAQEADWPNQHAWLAETLEQFDRVFRPRIRALDAADWNAGADGDDPEEPL